MVSDHPSKLSGKAACKRMPAEALLPEWWVQNWQKRRRVMGLQTWIYLQMGTRIPGAGRGGKGREGPGPLRVPCGRFLVLFVENKPGLVPPL